MQALSEHRIIESGRACAMVASGRGGHTVKPLDKLCGDIMDDEVSDETLDFRSGIEAASENARWSTSHLSGHAVLPLVSSIVSSVNRSGVTPIRPELVSQAVLCRFAATGCGERCCCVSMIRGDCEFAWVKPVGQVFYMPGVGGVVRWEFVRIPPTELRGSAARNVAVNSQLNASDFVAVAGLGLPLRRPGVMPGPALGHRASMCGVLGRRIAKRSLTVDRLLVGRRTLPEAHVD